MSRYYAWSIVYNTVPCMQSLYVPRTSPGRRCCLMGLPGRIGISSYRCFAFVASCPSIYLSLIVVNSSFLEIFPFDHFHPPSSGAPRLSRFTIAG